MHGGKHRGRSRDRGLDRRARGEGGGLRSKVELLVRTSVSRKVWLKRCLCRRKRCSSRLRAAFAMDIIFLTCRKYRSKAGILYNPAVVHCEAQGEKGIGGPGEQETGKRSKVGRSRGEEQRSEREGCRGERRKGGREGGRQRREEEEQEERNEEVIIRTLPENLQANFFW